MPNARGAKKKFAAGTSRGSRSAHTLLLQMAKEAEELAQQAQRITELREKKGRREGRRVPQPEVAEAVGVTLRAYQAWEAGDSDLDPKHLRALAEYHGVTRDYIEYGMAGRERDNAPDPFEAASLRSKLDEINAKLDRLVELLTGEESADAARAVGRSVADIEEAAVSPRKPERGRQATPRAARQRTGA